MFKKLLLALCLLGLTSGNASATISAKEFSIDFLKRAKTTTQNVLVNSSKTMFYMGIGFIVCSIIPGFFGNGQVGKVLGGVDHK